MNAPAKDVIMPPLVDFYIGTSFTIQALEEALLELAGHAMDLSKAHSTQRAVSMKLCADDVAKKANQIAALASHLAGVTEKHVKRNPLSGVRK